MERVEHWWGALAKDDGVRIPARDLYVGPYWATVRGLRGLAPRVGLDVRLWVASAGYGLVPEGASIRPYSATFRPNVADSAVRMSDASRGFCSTMWWDALASRRALGWRAPRRIGALARTEPRARFLVVASPGYIAAMKEDLLDVLDAQGTSDRLIIVSGESRGFPEALQRSWIDSNARLLSKVGGSLPALHARVARQILLDAPRFGLDASAIRARWARIAERSPEVMKPVRTPSNDEEVRSFIRDSLRKEPSLKHTKLLRDFRGTGRACEQNRFRNLFKQVVEEGA